MSFSPVASHCTLKLLLQQASPNQQIVSLYSLLPPVSNNCTFNLMLLQVPEKTQHTVIAIEIFGSIISTLLAFFGVFLLLVCVDLRGNSIFLWWSPSMPPKFKARDPWGAHLTIQSCQWSNCSGKKWPCIHLVIEFMVQIMMWLPLQRSTGLVWLGKNSSFSFHNLRWYSRQKKPRTIKNVIGFIAVNVTLWMSSHVFLSSIVQC